MILELSLYLLYFLSGLAALIYEIVFARALGHLLGASLLATASISGLFLLGLAVGAFAGGLMTSRFATRNAAFWLRCFALAELLVAVSGVAVPWLLMQHNQETLWAALHIAEPSLSYLARLMLAMLVVLPAATCMGATFPFTVQTLVARLRSSQWLYGLNALGASLGVLIGAFFLLPSLGLMMTGCAAAAIDSMVAVAALVLAYRVGAGISAPDTAPPSGGKTAGVVHNSTPVCSPQFLVMIATALGAAALIFQVCWTRLFVLIAGSSIYSLSIFLSICLLTSGIGSVVVARFLDRLRQPLIIAAAGCLVACLCTLAALYVADRLPWMFIVLNRALQQTFGTASDSLLLAGLCARWLIVATVVFLPSLSFAIVLPLLFTIPVNGRETALPAWLFASDSCGSMLGAVAAGFLIVPKLGELAVSGIQAGLLIYAALAALIGYALFFVWSENFVDDRATCIFMNCFVGIVLLATMLDIAMLRPSFNTAVMSAGPSFYTVDDLAGVDEQRFRRSVPSMNPQRASAICFYREGLNSTVTVERNSRSNIICLRTDGKVEAALPLSRALPAPTSDLSTHQWLAALPIIMHQGPSADVLVVGLGTGTTCGVALACSQAKHLTVAELEPAVYSASKFFSADGIDPLADPRVTALVNDGRYILSSAAQLYDAIICQPSDPWVNGSAELFSREFFQLAKSRLKPGGIMSQWLPLYCVSPRYLGVLCRTFKSVFPHAVLYRQAGAGECILLGSNEPMRARPAIPYGSDWLNEHQLTKLCDKIGADSGDYRLNTDDNLLLEMECGQNAIRQNHHIEDNLNIIKWADQP